jgi:hypothetical protein
MFSIERTRTVSVEKICTIPHYIDMSEELDDILNRVIGKIKLNKTVKEIAELNETNTSYVKVERVYYKLSVYSSLAVQKLNHTPEKYTKMSEILFPSLRKFIDFIDSANRTSYARSDVLLEELLKIEKFVEKNGNTIEYKSKFYRIAIDCGIYLEPKCYEVTEEDLKDKPKLRELLEIAEKNGYAEDSAPFDEWRRTQYLVYKESGNLLLEYNGSCYWVRAIGAP